MKAEGIPLSNLKQVADEYLNQDPAESSVGDFFELTEVQRRNGEFELWDQSPTLHVQKIQSEGVYSAPYSVKRNYLNIEKRLDSIVPVHEEDTLAYATIKPKLDRKLSNAVADLTLEALMTTEHTTLSFKEL